MNFLAHIALSGNDDDLLVGNFMGDFIKGSHWKMLPTRIAHGVLLHRAIDSFTDEHEESFSLRRLLHASCGKYAPIALDMLYDHLLAATFTNWYPQPLDEFAEESYTKLQSMNEYMPDRCRLLLSYMVRQDWLTSYADFEGIQTAMARMERRIGRDVGFHQAALAFNLNRNRFEDGFHRIFPEIQRMCSEKLVSFAR